MSGQPITELLDAKGAARSLVIAAALRAAACRWADDESPTIVAAHNELDAYLIAANALAERADRGGQRISIDELGDLDDLRHAGRTL